MTDDELLQAIDFSDYQNEEKSFSFLAKPNININKTATSTTEVKQTPKGTTVTKTVVEPRGKPYEPSYKELVNLINERENALLDHVSNKPDSQYIETDIGKYGNLPVTSEYISTLADAYREKEMEDVRRSANATRTLNNIANQFEDKINSLKVLSPYGGHKPVKNLEVLPNYLEENLIEPLSKLQNR